MFSKVVGIILTLAFVILAWYLYAIYPHVEILIFALLASIISIVTIILNYTLFNKDNNNEIEKGVDVTRIVFTGIAFLAFLVFFGLSAKLGGSAAEDSYASRIYENYEVGQYYLSSHGNFTLVSYATWMRMKILERIVIPVFILAFIWNFIHGVKTKGFKFMLTGSIKDIRTDGTDNSLATRVGFILLGVFFLLVFAIILISLF